MTGTGKRGGKVGTSISLGKARAPRSRGMLVMGGGKPKRARKKRGGTGGTRERRIAPSSLRKGCPSKTRSTVIRTALIFFRILLRHHSRDAEKGRENQVMEFLWGQSRGLLNVSSQAGPDGKWG